MDVKPFPLEAAPFASQSRERQLECLHLKKLRRPAQ